LLSVLQGIVAPQVRRAACVGISACSIEKINKIILYLTVHRCNHQTL